MSKVPNFGRITVGGLSARAMVPGKTLYDLVQVYDKAYKKAEAGDNPLSGNPGKWPIVNGVEAVVNAVLEAVYDEENREKETDRESSDATKESEIKI